MAGIFNSGIFNNAIFNTVGAVVAAAPQLESGAGSGGKRKFFEDEDELWLYIEALKGQFKREIEEKKEEVVEQLAEAQQAHGDIHAEAPFVHEPLDGLYAELDDLLASNASLESRWQEARRIEREYREQQEEDAIVTLLLDF